MQSMVYSEEASDPHQNVDLGHDGANDFHILTIMLIQGMMDLMILSMQR